MNIAIIDDGICHDEFDMPIETVCVGSKIQDSGFYQDDHYSHATVAAKIILKHCRPDSIIDIVFLDREDKADISDLCQALEYCLYHDIDVINLSCGTEMTDTESADYRRLVNVCRKLYDRKTVIYAAQDNYGRRTIPACFPYTISVECKDDTLMRSLSMYRRSDIYTSGSHSVYIKGEKYCPGSSNSFSCAYAASRHFLKKAEKDTVYSPLVTADLSFFDIRMTDDHFDLFFKGSGKLYGRIFPGVISSHEKKYMKKYGVKYLSLMPDRTTEKMIRNVKEYISDEYAVPIVKIIKGTGDSKIALLLCREFRERGYSSEVINTSLADIQENEIFISSVYLRDYSRILALFNGNEILFVISDDDYLSDEDDLEIIAEGDNCIRIVSGNKSLSVENVQSACDVITAHYNS